MRRWNGWGDDATLHPLPAASLPFLVRAVGPATAPHDASLADALSAVPASRLPSHRLVSGEPWERLRHARGQSLPDWIALRSGRIGTFPDGVAHPLDGAQVRELLAWAGQVGARVIPYGGGTSVVGHIDPLPGDAPVLTIDLSGMDGLLSLDEDSQLATFGAGTVGPSVERHLAAQGYTLGHYPQSWELSTLGGWVATRSSGQQSLRYGRIEQLFAGGRMETPEGPLEMAPWPASAAGPDLRELVLGSEGRLGVLTEVTVRVTRQPERESFRGYFFRDFAAGQRACRRLAQARTGLSMMRLMTAGETATTMALAGHRYVLGALGGVLSALGLGSTRCLAVLGFTGTCPQVQAARHAVRCVVRDEGGVPVGRALGHAWHRSRFRSPYLRNTLWERGYAIDTLETAVPWSAVDDTLEAVTRALRTGLEDRGEKVHAFSHLSHVYPTGSSLYTTYLFRLARDPDENLRRWRTLKTAATRALVDQGGTVSHQHGVGVDHQPWMMQEKGLLGLRALRSLARTFDPRGMMNPGKLVGDAEGP